MSAVRILSTLFCHVRISACRSRVCPVCDNSNNAVGIFTKFADLLENWSLSTAVLLKMGYFVVRRRSSSRSLQVTSRLKTLQHTGLESLETVVEICRHIEVLVKVWQRQQTHRASLPAAVEQLAKCLSHKVCGMDRTGRLGYTPIDIFVTYCSFRDRQTTAKTRSW